MHVITFSGAEDLAGSAPNLCLFHLSSSVLRFQGASSTLPLPNYTEGMVAPVFSTGALSLRQKRPKVLPVFPSGALHRATVAPQKDEAYESSGKTDTRNVQHVKSHVAPKVFRIKACA
ncbi:hypothetical protein BaRGS_00036061 [Batillaria attramentaria]|uniref:Uncharacterized protein n=1 Tax=Batillaria attramentaria TaxID=370345 RepID=A0ABD0JEA7_9CAEN